MCPLVLFYALCFAIYIYIYCTLRGRIKAPPVLYLSYSTVYVGCALYSTARDNGDSLAFLTQENKVQ